MSPFRWLDRAVRGSAGRVAVVQAVKATLAAVLSWLAAAQLFQLPQPFLAPWAAVLIVEATVYRSLRSACQQVAVVGVAVLLVAAVEWLVPWQVLGMAIALLAGLLVGQWHRFGDSGPWIGITALLLVTLGATQDVLLVDRLIETVLGAGIAIAVNGLVLPPVYGNRAKDATRQLASDMADLLAEMAEAFRHDEPPARPDRWTRRAGGAPTLLRQAERAIELNRESNRMNVRKTALLLRNPEEGWQPILANLRASWPHIAEIAQATHTTTDRVRPFDYPDPVARRAFAAVLDRLAELARLRGEGQRSGDAFDSAVEAARRALDELADYLETTPALGTAAGLAGMLLPAQHLLRDLIAC